MWSVENINITLQTLIQLSILAVSFYALKQIKVTKQIADKENQRESVKFATKLSENFLVNLINESDEVYDELLKKEGYKKVEKRGVINDFSLVWLKKERIDLFKHFKEVLRIDETTDILSPVITLMNKIESFSTPLVVGVADDSVVLSTCAQSFCKIIEDFYFVLVIGKEIGVSEKMPYYPNTRKLYDKWSNTINDIKKESEIDELNKRIAQLENKK